MRTLKQYLEAQVDTQLNTAQGIRYIENILTELYVLNDYLKQEQQDTVKIQRRIDAIKQLLLKAAGEFNIHGYTGNPFEGDMFGIVDTSIELFSEILTDYNNGTDNPLSWGKTCMDIIATFNEYK